MLKAKLSFLPFSKVIKKISSQLRLTCQTYNLDHEIKIISWKVNQQKLQNLILN